MRRSQQIGIATATTLPLLMTAVIAFTGGVISRTVFGSLMTALAIMALMAYARQRSNGR
jgi:hypothetical protein